ncbi:uncharacterized protein LOC110029896 [Phalaenopsis equestris]|uniref:uncharacterized protein LOC110029896 n=1 Tax=Phalaenopsis equestris TaxID=78828 RepID=UPI0009E1CA8C|nr:uncharacterized protein LOC110029896 [Phalaenopsis equestris]
MLASSDDSRHQPSAAVRHHYRNPHSLDYNIWAEMLIKSNHNSFGRHDSEQNFGPWARRPLSQLTNAATAAADDDELKYPPPAKANSRAQMIEKYRQEMMELVRNMPEEEGEEVGAYELSLRDIVERPATRKPEVDATEGGEDVNRNQSAVSRGEKKSETGSIMKAFVPRVRAALAGRKRITGAGGGKGAKVSPKPSNSDSEDRSCSSESCNSSGRRNRGGLGSCYVFLHKKKEQIHGDIN